jgi:ABC-type dipeptide/oligopeptide/nickel transport system ATPase subunit
LSESVIDVSGLTRHFGSKAALLSVSLSMARGGVYGLVGANGAGKTTLIKHILGLLRAESGSVRVFGLDPVADPVAVLSRIGYLSEEKTSRLDARRRAHSLLARILSRLGRCLRGGASGRRSRWTPPQNQQNVQGAEGAGRTFDRAGPSAGIIGLDERHPASTDRSPGFWAR